MKKVFLLGLFLGHSILSVAQTKNYVSFQAEIANKNGDFISIQDNSKVYKKIKVNKDGIFKDTLHIKEGLYQMFDGVEFTELYLKSGYDLTLKMDAKMFDESIVYSGVGSAENNFLAQAVLSGSSLGLNKLIEMNEADFMVAIDNKTKSDLAKLESSNLDVNFIALQKNNIERSRAGMTAFYKDRKAKLLLNNALNNSMASPFDYLNFKGGNTKLSDFNGKYVYIDVWATWCGPCIAEIPFLKKVEEKYEGKNIAFVSISVDVQKDFEKWKNLLRTNNWVAFNCLLTKTGIPTS